MSYGVKTPLEATGLAEVVDRILEKGVVIDVWAQVTLLGLDLLGVQARVVIASVETWLFYAKEVGLLARVPV